MSQLKKHTLFLRDGDWAYLTEVYSSRRIATSDVVRTVVAQFVDNLRAAEGDPEIKVEQEIEL
jgi:type IV secretory pathway TrbF-like protein